METILRIDNIEKYYGNRSSLTKAIDNISFEVDKGEFVAIMGASGSGKTTLLNCISTIDRVTSGRIYVGGQDITELKGNKLNRFRREQLGFIFQDFNLLDTLTAFENIALALSIQGVHAKEIQKRVSQLARELGISDVLDKYPYQMSGGQKQRVASARAIITNPKLILADEPTGALDSKASRMLLESFNYLNQELEATILMVTHDAFTARYADRVIFIKDGSEKKKGKIVTAPLVGTFYAAPAEDEEPFVKVGERVEKGQIVAIIEAMKLMNEIESDFAGTVTEVFVENGQSVEYGQPLFAVG